MQNKNKGFTLLEILIALFIFTILSLILVNALHNVINVQSHTETKAERLRTLQMALLMMSRDIEQTLNRPILNSAGKEEAPFLGSADSFSFTHAGIANPTGTLSRSALQRTRYFVSDDGLWRETWPVLDQAEKSQSHKRKLLTTVVNARFEFLDNEGRFQNAWPLPGQADQVLPRAVKIYLTLNDWGSITQLYVITAESSKTSITKKS